jgi:hypothetical protein
MPKKGANWRHARPKRSLAQNGALQLTNCAMPRFIEQKLA